MKKELFIIITTLLLIGVSACTQTDVQIQKGEPMIIKKTIEEPAAEQMQTSPEDAELNSLENELANLDKNEETSLEEDLNTI